MKTGKTISWLPAWIFEMLTKTLNRGDLSSSDKM